MLKIQNNLSDVIRTISQTKGRNGHPVTRFVYSNSKLPLSPAAKTIVHGKISLIRNCALERNGGVEGVG